MENGYFLLLFLLLSSFSLPNPVQELLEKGISIDLKNPVYQKGVLSTTEGGVVAGPRIRIQAQNITFSDKPEQQLRASGCLLVEYCNFAFVGQELVYDFASNQGYILCGRIGVEPYFLFAQRIDLYPDGTYAFSRLHLTTTEEMEPEWALVAEEATLSCERYLKAQKIQFRLFNFPVFWIPWLSLDLKTILESPIKYRIRWGGEQGWRLGLIYELYASDTFNFYLRFDYRLNRGPSGGFETDYVSCDKRHYLLTKNYVARDNSIEQPNQRFRYRFQGLYGYVSESGDTSVGLTYDKLSDKLMASDYAEKEMELKTGKKTAFNFRHKEDWVITNFYTRLKINSFQTVKQELPTLSSTFYPVGIIYPSWKLENTFKIGYLNYDYTDRLLGVSDYNSARIFFCPRLYSARKYKWLNVTPAIGGTGIVYSKTPVSNDKILVLGSFDIDCNASLSRTYCGQGFSFKHTLIPYTHYTYCTAPTLNANAHYIFDIQDGLSHLNMMRTGIRNLFYQFGCRDPFRILTLDLYTNFFFDTPTIGSEMPKIYTDLLWDVTERLRTAVSWAWDFQHSDMDHLNWRLDWTVASYLAFAVEYRQRSRFSFRKSDYSNFFLDSFRTTEELVHSPVSDRRNTLLFHTYFRFHPKWALNLYLRHGWHRTHEPNYTEYEVDLMTTIRSIWHAKITYQKRTDDHRIALYFYLSLDRPTYCTTLL